MAAKKKISLITQIAIGLFSGVIVGLLLNYFPDQKGWLVAQVLQPAGDAFIKLMKMIIVRWFSPVW